jgi:hypothetical protein
MSKIKYTVAIFTSVALLLSACNQGSSLIPVQNNPSLPSKENQVPVEEVHSSDPVQKNTGLRASSDEIDWEQVHDKLLSNEMIAELYSAVDAIVNHDQTALDQLFGSDGGAALAYVMEHTTQFTDIDPAYIENERILVPVRGMRQLQGDDKVQQATLFFYFMKNSKSEWHLVTID